MVMAADHQSRCDWCDWYGAGPDHGQPPDIAKHISLWDPETAEWVADWLDDQARTLKHHLPAWNGQHWSDDHYPVDDPPPPGYRNPERVNETVEYHYRHALKVARALNKKNKQ